MSLWMVRAGRHGEQESLALEQGMAVIGWDELTDLAQVSTRDQIEELCHKTFPHLNQHAIGNWVSQLWAFRHLIQPDDKVVLPLKTRAAIAVGRVAGAYEYHPEGPQGAKHTRPVEWLRTDIPRSAFDSDLLASFGALKTVCQIQRSNGEDRVQAVVEGRVRLKTADEVGLLAPEEAMDLEEYGHDQIREHIARKFRGHEMAWLVDSILVAQGYHTHRSQAGPDGGVDIIAGKGPMGFDPPRLVVQVKSGDSPVDINVLRELQGVMRNFGANQGLLVSWGGFKPNVLAEARRHFFEIRLWDAGDVVKNLLENYESFAGTLLAEVPLKRIWVLAPEE